MIIIKSKDFLIEINNIRLSIEKETLHSDPTYYVCNRDGDSKLILFTSKNNESARTFLNTFSCTINGLDIHKYNVIDLKEIKENMCKLNTN